MLAISTMWNALKQTDGAALFDELKDLGFEAIELSRHLTPDQIQQLKVSLRENSPCSIHNFCPILSGTSQADAEKDKLLLSSLKYRRTKRGYPTHSSDNGTRTRSGSSDRRPPPRRS